MATPLSTLLRGLVGVAATVLLVVIAWTLYVQRDSVAQVATPLVGLVKPRGPDPEQEPAAPSTGTAPAGAVAPDVREPDARDPDTAATPTTPAGATRATTGQVTAGESPAPANAVPATEGAPRQ
jgi:hypothetical protein